MEFIDRIIGVYHFLTDRVPGGIPVVDPKPRNVNPWLRDGQALVSKVAAGGDIRDAVGRSVACLGDLRQVIGRGDRVLVKPNFNSPDPYPGSTDLEFLRAVLEVLLETGASVTIGESSGGVWRPTRKVFQKVGLFDLVRDYDVPLIAFEDRTSDWVRVKVKGDYLDTVCAPRLAYEADRVVYLACMKTHQLSGYSGALKLAVGFMHPGERRSLHARDLKRKLAEISLCWQPNLIIMDGRKSFISGGPATGQLAEPRVILASGDLVAIDVEAMSILLGYRARNKLPADPWQAPEIVTALGHGLGVGRGKYRVVS